MKDFDLAPQVGLEPTTLRLTAEWLVAASQCKQKELGLQKADLAGNWGDSGGTLRGHWQARADSNRDPLR
jgi:hypothetical protein